MWPAWATASVYTWVSLAVVSVPPVLFTSTTSRAIYVAITVPLLGLIGGLMHYALVTRPIASVSRSVEKCMLQHGVTDRYFAAQCNFERKGSSGGFASPSMSLTISKRFQQQLIDEITVGSYHSEIYRLQAHVKDLLSQYFTQQLQRMDLEKGNCMRENEANGTKAASPTKNNSGVPSIVPPLNLKRVTSPKHHERGNGRGGDEGDLESCRSDDEKNAFPVVIHPNGGTNNQESIDPAAPMPYPRTSAQRPQADDSSPVAVPITASSSGQMPCLSTVDRGGRFPGDSSRICLYITRSTNRNIVVYEAKLQRALGSRPPTLDPKKPLHGYWLDIDPEYVSKNRAKGKLDDREELNFIERKMAYGMEVKPHPTEVGAFQVSFVALKKRPMTLRMGRARLITSASNNPDAQPPPAAGVPANEGALQVLPLLYVTIQGVECVCDNIYVSSTEPKHIWNWPTVEYVEISGRSVLSGEKKLERLSEDDSDNDNASQAAAEAPSGEDPQRKQS